MSSNLSFHVITLQCIQIEQCSVTASWSKCTQKTSTLNDHKNIVKLLQCYAVYERFVEQMIVRGCKKWREVSEMKNDLTAHKM